MNILNKEILCTLGPASRNERVITRLEDLGVSLFRINLSHTKLEDLPEIIKSIQKISSVPICLDTEGAQVRTGKLKNNTVQVKENNLIQIVPEIIEGNEEKLNLYPPDVINLLKVGDMISIDFNSVLVQVVESNIAGLFVRVITGGTIGSNKAVSVDREIPLFPLTTKDKEAIKLGLNFGILHFALSFANHQDDVELIRSMVGEQSFVISKIETLMGIRNLDGISKRSDAILLDRGDLSRQLPIEQIPRAQKEIIKRAKKNAIKFYVATNLLESMCTQPSPTRAEVNDIFNTLADGADGLVLAAETAIGQYPVQCAMMVHKLIKQFKEYSNNAPFLVERIFNQNPNLLIDPHGGELINRIATEEEIPSSKTLPQIKVSLSNLMDVEQIAIGTYSPLKGFLNKNEIESVLNHYTLPNGIVWTLPITLQIDSTQLNGIKLGDRVALCLEGTEDIYATLEINDIFNFDLNEYAQKVFLTNDQSHPGVKQLFQGGSSFIAGEVKLLHRLPSEYKYYEITPAQARSVFENKGWVRIVAFHTRNVAHRAHEYIQLSAHKKLHCDGIFIHPLIGPKKTGDFTPEVILKSYEMLIEKYFPPQEAMLAAFQSYPRYSGPREAVFTAICRKNFGCNYIVVGRDHSGVGNFYSPNASQELFTKLGDIGIKPVFFNEVNFCNICNAYTENCGHSGEAIVKISGTQAREMINNQKTPPAWFMREEISNYLIKTIAKDKKVFVE